MQKNYLNNNQIIEIATLEVMKEAIAEQIRSNHQNFPIPNLISDLNNKNSQN